jgi:hypothetical protein
MVSLVDIGPQTKEVELRPGVSVTVRGVTAMGVFSLLQEFPELKLVLTGKVLEGDIVTSLFNAVPQAIASIIAMGCGKDGDPEYIAAAHQLRVGEQALLMQAIAEITFPQGVRSFIDGLVGLADQAGARGWGQVTKSPEPSNGASQTGTPPATPGNTPPDSSEPGQS